MADMTKREKLARAACRVQCPLVHPALACDEKCTAHPDSSKLAEHSRQVDAILAELREMLEVGDKCKTLSTMAQWQAMIDAIGDD